LLRISNLYVLQWIQVRTDNFKRFYGDWEKDGIELRRLVVDAKESSRATRAIGSSSGTSGSSNSRLLVGESKEPVIFYHGTKDAIEAGFNLDPPNRKDNGWLGQLRRIN